MAGNDSYTKLLLQMRGINGSQTFYDQSGSRHTVTANNQVQIECPARIGNGAGNFDGTGDYLSASDHVDWDFSTNPFTIEFWVYFRTVARSGLINHGGAGGSNVVGWSLHLESGYNLEWNYYDGGSWYSKSESWTPNTDR